LKLKGGSELLRYYNGSLIQALTDLYPELLLNQKNIFHSKGSILYLTLQLLTLSLLEWEKAQHRKFFDAFAKSKGFDPLQTEKWYSISRKHIKAIQVSLLLWLTVV
jgi:hypothetical protein